MPSRRHTTHARQRIVADCRSDQEFPFGSDTGRLGIPSVRCIRRDTRRHRANCPKHKAGVLPLPSHNNLYGSIAMGAYGELLPGGYPTPTANEERIWPRNGVSNFRFRQTGWNALSLSRGKREKCCTWLAKHLVGWQPKGRLYDLPEHLSAGWLLPRQLGTSGGSFHRR